MAHIRKDPPSAHWMHPSDLDDEFFTHGAGKILLGEARGKLIGIDDNRHVVTVAGSRAGKSTTSLMSNLLTWTGSTLVIDPKGELATNTAEHRAKMGQDVHILDPFGEVKGDAARYRCGYDPLNELKAGSQDDSVDDADMIADALIVEAKGKEGDHWTLSAKNLLRGLILFLLQVDNDHEDQHATLAALRELVSLPFELDEDGDDPTLIEALETMNKMPHFEGAISAVGGSVIGKPEGERGSVISTASEQTSFLDSTPLKKHLTSAGLSSLRQLKRKPTTIYLVLPASRMGTHFRWLRVIISLAMSAMEREETKENTPPVLFILEEFPSLGYMRQIESAAGLMAGYGVKLWSVMQDMSQLKAHYPNSWETFLGNAGILEAFGTADSTTTKYLSDRIGQSLSVVIQSTDVGISGQQRGEAPERETIQQFPLIAPFEITRQFHRDTGRKLVLIPELPPFHIKRVHWTDSRL